MGHTFMGHTNLNFKVSLSINANESKTGGSSSLRVSHRGRCVGYPLHTKSFSVPLPPPRLPIVCLNFEQTISGISISIHFRTVVANSNNFQTHLVCNLLSTNEINPGSNIFHNNVMQNGISKIVKSGRFRKFLRKSGRLQKRIDIIVQKGRSTSESDLVGIRIL